MGIPRADFFKFLFNMGRGILKNQVDWSVMDSEFDADVRRAAASAIPPAVSESTEADAIAGTDDADANASRMTPRRTKQAIDAQGATARVAGNGLEDDPDDATKLRVKTDGDSVTVGANGVSVTNPFTDADEASLDEVHAGAQRRVWDVHYAGSGNANLANGLYIPRLNGTALGNNVNWTDANINQLDLADVDSFYQGITDTTDMNFDNQFVDAGSDQSDKYAEIRVGGNIRIINLSFSSGQWISTGGLMATISGVQEITGGYRLALTGVMVIGVITRGDDIQVGVNPNREQIRGDSIDYSGALAVADPVSGQTFILTRDSGGRARVLTIDHLERHFADRYKSFGIFSIVPSAHFDAKGEIDASQLTNASKIIRIGLPDNILSDFTDDVTSGMLVELYRDASNYLLGRVTSVTTDSLKSTINGRYVYLSTLELVGSVGVGDTAEFRLYVQGDGLVPIPASENIGEFLKAVGVNQYEWKAILVADVAGAAKQSDVQALYDALDTFYDGWQNGADADDSDLNAMVTASNGFIDNTGDAETPSASQRVIWKSVAWTSRPTGWVAGFHLLSGTTQYAIGISANLDDLFMKWDGSAWQDLASDDEIYQAHPYQTLTDDHDFVLVQELQQGGLYDVPGFYGWMLFRSIDRDIVGCIPNGFGSDDYGITHTINKFGLAQGLPDAPGVGTWFLRKLTNSAPVWTQATQSVIEGLYTPPKPVVSDELTVTSAWQVVEDGFTSDDLVEVNTEGAYANESGNIGMIGVTRKFANYPTTARWLGIRANAQGSRIEIRRNGDAIEARTQGQTANTKAWTIKY